MRKLISAFTIAVLMVSGAYAGVDQVVQKVRKEAYQEGYKKGYQDAIEQNKEKWIKEGEKRVINRIKKYGDLVNRVFNYKVLLQKGIILPPQVALICDGEEVTSDVYKPMNCYYKIVAHARFVKPGEMTFKSLIEEGNVDRLTNNVSSPQIIDTVYFIGVFNYDTGLRVVRKLYDLGFRTIQRNVNGKLVVGVFPTSADKLALIKSEFPVKKMSIAEFMSYTVAKELEKVKPIGEKKVSLPIDGPRTGVALVNLRIREIPSRRGKTVGWLKRGMKVKILGREGGWYHIIANTLSGIREGYVSASYIKVED